jgi:hypothetical protein
MRRFVLIVSCLISQISIGRLLMQLGDKSAELAGTFCLLRAVMNLRDADGRRDPDEHTYNLTLSPSGRAANPPVLAEYFAISSLEQAEWVDVSPFQMKVHREDNYNEECHHSSAVSCPSSNTANFLLLSVGIRNFFTLAGISLPDAEFAILKVVIHGCPTVSTSCTSTRSRFGSESLRSKILRDTRGRTVAEVIFWR